MQDLQHVSPKHHMTHQANRQSSTSDQPLAPISSVARNVDSRSGMSTITSDNAKGWQIIADQLSVQRPSTGKLVRVTKSRKHAGNVCSVERHQLSKYSDAYRYASDAQAHMRDMAGRSGWCCKLRVIATGECFWIDANNVEVVEVIFDGDGNETIRIR